MKRLLSFLVALFLATTALWAYDFKEGDLCYNIIGDNMVEVTCFYWDNNYPELTSVSIPASVTHNSTIFAVTYVGDEAFNNCENLTSVSIPNSITRIGEYAFAGCGITSIVIPNSVTTIGYKAFKSCTNLCSITLPNGITRIEPATFEGCESLASIVIPDNVTTIGYGAFMECHSLTSITIPHSVTRIECNEEGLHPFVATNLTSIIVDKANKTYDSRNNCNAIIETATNSLLVGCQTTRIPNSITAIGPLAFGYCHGLTSITIPSGVMSIGNSAFEDCTNLVSLYLGTPAIIWKYAFAACPKLTAITCYTQEPPVADAETFRASYEDNVEDCTDCTNYDNIILYVPGNSLSAYQSNDVWGKFKNIQCIASEPTTVDGMTATPAVTTVTFDWQANKSAASYILVVSTDQEVFCSLVFNAKGQLNSIAYAPGRNGQRHQSAAMQTADGFRFTVIGLSEATHYTYSMTVKDVNDIVRNTYTGDFTTLGTPAAVDDIDNAVSSSAPQKILRNGQVLIQRGTETYTITGVELN